RFFVAPRRAVRPGAWALPQKRGNPARRPAACSRGDGPLDVPPHFWSRAGSSPRQRSLRASKLWPSFFVPRTCLRVPIGIRRGGGAHFLWSWSPNASALSSSAASEYMERAMSSVGAELDFPSPEWVVAYKDAINANP